jgi:hypothetical protein
MYFISISELKQKMFTYLQLHETSLKQLEMLLVIT